jgi:hypothetical protein
VGDAEADVIYGSQAAVFLGQVLYLDDVRHLPPLKTIADFFMDFNKYGHDSAFIML